MFMIGFTVKGSYITNKKRKEILKIFDKFSFVKISEDKRIQMIVHGKRSGFRHIGLCSEIILLTTFALVIVFCKYGINY